MLNLSDMIGKKSWMILRSFAKPMNEFLEHKAKKEGRTTTKKLTENLLKAINDDEVEFMIYVIKDKSGEIKAGWSESTHLQLLGLLETGKVIVTQDMYKT